MLEHTSLSKPPLSHRIALAAAVLLLAVLLGSTSAVAQELDPAVCQKLIGQDMLEIPEITRDAATRTLPAVITIADEERVLWFKAGGDPYCAKQRIRFVKGHSTVHEDETWPAGDGTPLPAPTLRARLGDVVQLTVLNQIDPSWFAQSYVKMKTGEARGCDTTRGEDGEIYPGKSGDVMPNCFHGSSTTNIHFHGTHTNPNNTGDNVFLQIRPSLRENGKPVVTEETFRQEFNGFFRQCAERLQSNPDVPSGWPYHWEEMPEGYRRAQEYLLYRYDSTAQYEGANDGLPEYAQLLPANRALIEKGEWPHYYIGAFPYCFELPEYRPADWPPQDPRHLQMGQAPGTHWYHAHKHGSTHLNVSNALTGVLIVEGDYDRTLHEFYGSQDHALQEKVLVIQQLGMSPPMMRAPAGQVFHGDELSVNGRRQPVLTMRPGEVQLWRVVNTSARSGVYFNSPENSSGAPALGWRQTAQDGVQLHQDNYGNDAISKNVEFLLAAGNRADLLVQAPMSPTDTPIPVVVSDTVSTGKGTTDITLFRVRVEGEPVQLGRAFPAKEQFPRMPPFLADISEPGRKRELVFNSKGVVGAAKKVDHTIDGKKFQGKVADQLVKFGVTEEWKIVNHTGEESFPPPIAHPFHIHINPFQVVEVFDPAKQQATDSSAPCYVNPDEPEDTWKPCTDVPKPFFWWDVFPMPTAGSPQGSTTKIPGYFKMRSRFVDYAGQFVLHCHILAHEDRGMMQFVEVYNPRLKGPHH